MNIWQIDEQMQQLVDPETGELLDCEAFAALAMERDKKIENAACWAVNCAAEAKAIREQEKVLAERRKEIERRADRLKEYVQSALDGASFSTDRVSVSFRKSSSVEVDPDFIAWAMTHAPDLLTYKTPEPNKTEIKKYLKENELEFARVAESRSMTIK